MSLVIRANYLADQTQNCNSAILYISSTNPKFSERLKRFDLGTIYKQNKDSKKCVFALSNLQIH
jgi:hypothetical protein